MILILGHCRDILVERVLAALGSARARLVDQQTLFAETAFATTRSSRRLDGFIRIDGEDLPFGQISGVLARLNRDWWPGADFDLQDQTFVYHETMASWFHLLAGLPCPVVNRTGLAYWLNDPTCHDALLTNFARRIGSPPSTSTPRSSPTPPDPATISLYLAGRRIIPACAPACAPAGHLEARREALSAWQVESGISLARLDFDAGHPHAPYHIDPAPLLDDEPSEVVERVAAGLIEVLR